MKIVSLQSDDNSGDSPNDWGGWKLYSFSHRHLHFKHPSAFEMTIGLRRKLECGTAFWCSYFEHGGCVWSLAGQGPQCQFDSVHRAGILVWEEAISDLPSGFDARKKHAEGFLDTYTKWCNGEVYGYSVVEVVTLPCGHTEEKFLDSCWGFYDVEDMASEVRNVVMGDEVEFKGECAWLAESHDFVGKVAV